MTLFTFLIFLREWFLILLIFLFETSWIKIFFGKKYDESEDDSVETQADGVSDKV